MKRVVKVNLASWGSMVSLDDLVSSVNDALDVIGEVYLEADYEMGYEGDISVSMNLVHQRLETDEEYNERLAQEQYALEREETRQLNLYRKLHKKYGGK